MKIFLERYQNIIIKVIFILFIIVFAMPSIIYLINNKTVLGFQTYYNFFINDSSNKNISTIIYLILFMIITIIYLYFIKKKNLFKNIKQILIFTGITSTIFMVMLPWTSSDVFYYMGVGELNSAYVQNPYYVSIKDYCNDNKEMVKEDSIMKQGYNNYWSGTTVVYGPIAQIIFSSITKLSFKSIDISLLLFKLLNLIVHLLNCYLIFKLTKKLKFVLIYGLNPYILLEFLGNVHNDIIVVFFILLSLYFLIKKKQILPCVIILAIATGIKYFTVLLLPVVILYYFRTEKIWKRLWRCLQYGLVFLGIILLEYTIYFKDMSIFTAMMVQNEKLSKSIYSGIVGIGKLKNIEEINILGNEFEISRVAIMLRNSMFGIFAITYIKFCIDLLATKHIKLSNSLRKYNIELILFLLALATWQQWYIVWLFATIFWQKTRTIKCIICISLSSEIANSIYMFLKENYYYDIYFWGIMIGLFLVTKGVGHFGKIIVDRWK